MAVPKSQTAFDPSRTPFTTPAPRYTYIDLPLGVRIKVNSDTRVVEKIDGKPYPGYPHKLPPELMAVDQPNIMTCGVPSQNNLGCDAAVNGGCPILRQYGRIGRVNLIVEKNGYVNSAACNHVYCGISNSGRPTSQVHLLMDGYQILTDRTVIPENIRDQETKREYVRYTEVPDLAPFYEEMKVGRFAVEKKKRGRPKKKVEIDADREDRPASQI